MQFQQPSAGRSCSAQERIEQRDFEHVAARASCRDARPRPSAGPSATGSSRSAPGSRRSPHSSWLGPAEGRAGSPAQEILP